MHNQPLPHATLVNKVSLNPRSADLLVLLQPYFPPIGYIITLTYSSHTIVKSLEICLAW